MKKLIDVLMLLGKTDFKSKLVAIAKLIFRKITSKNQRW
jgi:hypothetical protein